MTIKEILKPIHNSPESAYVVNDYPYGFRLRCRIKYWLEFNKTHGYRFVSQTTNPKKAGEVWNKPKKSTYYNLAAALFLNEENHLKITGITVSSSSEQLKSWLEKYETGLTEDIKFSVVNAIKVSELIEEKFRTGEFKYNVTVRQYEPI